jgi:HK97 gp10 family phage protein
MSGMTIQFTGMVEFQQLLDEIKQDFSEKDQKKILTTAVRQAMSPVLSKAQALAPKDTGALTASLRLEARKPTKRDRKSIYVNTSDVVIGTVTTASGKQLAKKTFKNIKTGKKQKGIASDGRAIANEFGTKTEFGSVHNAAKPYMRPALETSAPAVLNSLSEVLKVALERYRSKTK